MVKIKEFITAAVLLTSLAEAQPYQAVWEHDDPSVRDASNYGPQPQIVCDEPYCGAPCKPSPPPPRCPHSMVDCRSGCVCFTDCATRNNFCFQMKYCIRRFVTSRRTVGGNITGIFAVRTSTVSDDNLYNVKTKKNNNDYMSKNGSTRFFNHGRGSYESEERPFF